MEKVASGGSLHALGDATNLRPQLLQLRPTSLPSVNSQQCGEGEAPDDSENAAPTISCGRKRPAPADESLDEPDGPMAASASLPRSQQPSTRPLKKRQRPSEQPQPAASTTAAASDAVVSTGGSPINLVKRECGVTLNCIAEFKQHRFQLLHQQQQQHHQGYVSVPSELPASDLTRFVLNAFSIGAVNPADCETKLEMPNWKRLALNDICDNLEATSVGSLLQHVCGAALLRIELPLPDSVVPPSSIIRTLIRSLVPPQTAPGGQVLWLKQIGCPLSEATLQAYLQSSDSYEFLAAERASFSDWHNRMCLQYLEQMAKTPPSLLALPLPIMSLSVGRQSQAYQQAPVGAEVSMETTQSQPTPPSLTAASSPAVSSRGTGQRPGRLRACFDSELELPLLQAWFAENPHPSREQLDCYRDALNSHLMRRNGIRRPLSSANVAYWFKNMRATDRRLSSSTSATASISATATGPSATAAGPSGPRDPEPGDFDNNSSGGSSPPPHQAPLRLCIDEDEAQEEGAGLSAVQSMQSQLLQQPVSVNESIDSGGGGVGSGGGGGGASKRRRTRVFIDPTTEIPQLEIWFNEDSHPSSAQFQLYAQILNSMPFRQRQPPLEAKNVQLWFKNHRAKVKRERAPEATSVTEAGAQAGPSAAEVDTTEGCADDETVNEASPLGALQLVCKAENCEGET
ncbi:hypothetical protein BOX15_Mlig006878g4 [Macrostomum lignano]|uniref:Homeobox domain-containing protein n=1 Tax=Macrostomum lignano TaxID=282301 RepID=A0A267DNK4_9PLAT|nr:hypothetical protein BOX15_Mlig006878g4 [Macrostomum lignano]